MYQGTVSAFPPLVSTGTSAQEVAVDCLKPVYPFTDLETVGGMLNPEHLAEVFESDHGSVMLVPPDKSRQFVDRRQFKEIFDPSAPGSGARQPDAHGFGYVDPGELEASDGNAAYYSFAPSPGLRYIVLDTVSKAGVVAGVNRNGQQFGGHQGRIDNPQFEWLERELERAADNDELVVAFGHHARTSLVNDDPDERNPCTGIGDRGRPASSSAGSGSPPPRAARRGRAERCARCTRSSSRAAPRRASKHDRGMARAPRGRPAAPLTRPQRACRINRRDARN